MSPSEARAGTGGAPPTLAVARITPAGLQRLIRSGGRKWTGLRRRLTNDAEAGAQAAVRLRTPVLATESGFKACKVAEAVAQTVNEETLVLRHDSKAHRTERESSPGRGVEEALG